MKLFKRFQGLSLHRFKDNPLERAFAHAWQETNTKGGGGRDTLAFLLDPSNRGEPVPALTERDYLVAATVIQWLGSPVGQSWLAQVLEQKEASFIRRLLCTAPRGS